MLTEKELAFIGYWKLNRDKHQKSFKQFLKGLYRGLAICAAILAVLFGGWYTRANMEASTKLSASIMTFAFFAIAIFMAWIYQNYQWEMNEQQYLELLAKQENLNRTAQH